MSKGLLPEAWTVLGLREFRALNSKLNRYTSFMSGNPETLHLNTLTPKLQEASFLSFRFGTPGSKTLTFQTAHAASTSEV